ncbi:ferrous iron transport protein B [Bacteroidota bacterium]
MKNSASENILVALVGNPNSGKTSLFNQLTGLNQKIGNYPGVTVDKKTGICSVNKKLSFEVLDLPGSYSIFPRSDDERVVFETLFRQDVKQPDIVVVIADTVNLKRNLLLFSQLKDLGVPVILALNMLDVAERSGIRVNADFIRKTFSVPVVRINARNGDGIDDLKNLIADNSISTNDAIVYDVHNLAPELIDFVKDELGIENDYLVYQFILQSNSSKILSEDQREKISVQIQNSGIDLRKLQATETIERYQAINRLLDGAWIASDEDKKFIISDRIDKIFTHKIWGYFTLLAIMMLIFQAIFSWASYPMGLIDGWFVSLSGWLDGHLPEGVLTNLITQGIIPGFGGIMMFIPQIAILFAFIAILEESGYMSRVVFLMDKIMRKFGLNGRSVVPLLSGIACAVPAIMTTRSIDNRKDRLITILVTPLMSCSARLPVYTILIALIVPEKYILGVFNLQGLVLMSLYGLGFLAALISAAIATAFIKRRFKSFLIMELPLYKTPRWKNVGITIWDNVRTFAWEAGRIILAISVILWVLASYGPSDDFKNADQIVAVQIMDDNSDEKEFSNRLAAYKLEHSYAGIFGKSIEPVIKPLGFDWKIGIALITSFAAREVFVGTMATIYSIGTDHDDNTLINRMRSEVNPDTGEPVYKTATAFSLIIFYVFAMQCMSTLAVVVRETKTWKWAVIQFSYLFVLAYISSLIVFNIFS